MEYHAVFFFRCSSLFYQHVEVIMLICVFIFETEGLDEGSWIKVLNLTLGREIRGSGGGRIMKGIHGCEGHCDPWT